MKFTMIIGSAITTLAACAGYAPSSDMRGFSEAEVVQQLGPPTGRYQLPEGPTRLEFWRGPSGRHTYMVDFEQGRVTEWNQVLDRRYFEAVTPGMTSDQLLRFIGHPSEVMGMMRDGKIWSYRYANADCLWWQAQLDAQGVVTSAGYALQPQCNAPNRP